MNELENSDPIMAPEVGRSAAPTLGLLLRKAREARGLSIDDVVQTLKFSVRQVEAIESDRLDLLPGPVFQRGFVRSYARLLKLDPDSLLGLIDVRAPAPEPEVRPPDNMGNAAPRGGFKQIPPLVFVSILLLLAAAVMTGWHYLGGGISQMRMAVESAQNAIDEAKPAEAEDQAPVQPVPAVADVVEPTPAVPVAEPALMAPVAPAAAVVATPTTMPVTSSAATVQPSQAPPSSAQPAQQLQAAQPAGSRNLSFEFTGQSWIEVKDASGLVILTGVYTSGIHSAVGRAPFEIVIGNAAVVAARDEGRVVDLKPHTRSEVARLTLK